METDSIDSVIDDDEIHQKHQFSSTKSQGGATVVISPATSVYELLECPVCTNSMYPPIHQVRISSSPNIGGLRKILLLLTNIKFQFLW